LLDRHDNSCFASDMAELIGMCDRILVVHNGRITWEARRDEFSEAKILAHAAGLMNGNSQDPADRPVNTG